MPSKQEELAALRVKKEEAQKRWDEEARQECELEEHLVWEAEEEERVRKEAEVRVHLEAKKRERAEQRWRAVEAKHIADKKAAAEAKAAEALASKHKGKMKAIEDMETTEDKGSAYSTDKEAVQKAILVSRQSRVKSSMEGQGLSKRLQAESPKKWPPCDKCKDRGMECPQPEGQVTSCPPCVKGKLKCNNGGVPWKVLAK
ncbi:hypothetical protein AX14_007550 [Amanita brunnescens Koide BX004]|nr:hypothetical protein AX14_007550 [Amanita brunnescens Koide BX004]